MTVDSRAFGRQRKCQSEDDCECENQQMHRGPSMWGGMVEESEDGACVPDAPGLVVIRAVETSYVRMAAT